MDSSEAVAKNPARHGPATPVRALPSADAGGGARRRRPGPKTPAAKTSVRLNAVRHGIFATDPVIPGVERPEDWDAHRAGVLESLRPVGHLQTVLALRVASALWRLERVTAYEREALARVSKGRRPELPPSHDLDKIVKYEAHLSRQLYQAKHELEALQKESRGEATPLARMDVNVHGVAEP